MNEFKTAADVAAWWYVRKPDMPAAALINVLAFTTGKGIHDVCAEYKRYADVLGEEAIDSRQSIEAYAAGWDAGRTMGELSVAEIARTIGEWKAKLGLETTTVEQRQAFGSGLAIGYQSIPVGEPVNATPDSVSADTVPTRQAGWSVLPNSDPTWPKAKDGRPAIPAIAIDGDKQAVTLIECRHLPTPDRTLVAVISFGHWIEDVKRILRDCADADPNAANWQINFTSYGLRTGQLVTDRMPTEEFHFHYCLPILQQRTAA